MVDPQRPAAQADGSCSFLVTEAVREMSVTPSPSQLLCVLSSAGYVCGAGEKHLVASSWLLLFKGKLFLDGLGLSLLAEMQVEKVLLRGVSHPAELC